MVKCETLAKICIVVEKGSTVLLSEEQFELIKDKVKLIKEPTEKKKTNAK